MESHVRPVAAVLGRLARNPRAAAAPDYRGDDRGKRANDRDAAGDSVCGRADSGRALGDLRAVRSRSGRTPMTRPQLEHIIRAAGTIADDDDVVVIGSQAI